MRFDKEGNLSIQQSANPKSFFLGRKGHLLNTNYLLVSVSSAQVSFGILHHGQFPHIGLVPPLGWPCWSGCFSSLPEEKGECKI